MGKTRKLLSRIIFCAHIDATKGTMGSKSGMCDRCSSVTVAALLRGIRAPVNQSLKSKRVSIIVHKFNTRIMGKKSKKSKVVELPKRTIQSYEDEIAQKLKVIEELESKKDKLELETDDLKEYLETHGSAQQDIKDFIEKKVIIKEDKIDGMVDIEEVTLSRNDIIN